MRLINTVTGKMEEFFGDSIPTKYAILSHRWGKEEVTFREWMNKSFDICQFSSRKGIRKIGSFCRQAREDDINWAWVDTCCIDKTSSQELSEAINSMFAWYHNSSVCYVYLHDYHRNDFDAPSLRMCEWFFRGWTLQELIAPRRVEFYNSQWQRFGAKSESNMCAIVSSITGIDSEFLLGADLESASIAKKMSWASNRETGRLEDMAYSLLGIFDINMPLLYGEGSKAFRRLQEEIMKTYPMDHSLYAWGTTVRECSIEAPEGKEWDLLNGADEYWPASPQPLYGLLANSPKDFEGSRNYSPSPVDCRSGNPSFAGQESVGYPTVLGKGIRIELPQYRRTTFCYQHMQPRVRQFKDGLYAMLLCRDDTDESVVLCIPLIPWGIGYMPRPKELLVTHLPQYVSLYDFMRIKHLKLVIVTPEKKETVKPGSIIVRGAVDTRSYEERKEDILVFGDRWFGSYGVFEPVAGVTCGPVLISFKRDGVSERRSIALKRSVVANANLPVLNVAIIPSPGLKGLKTSDLLHHKVFISPLDVHTIDTEGLPLIDIRVEKIMFPNEDGFVDAVDILVRDRNVVTNEIRMPSQSRDWLRYLLLGTYSGSTRR
ncbi:HET-domain-containing protein [Daldinia eschscholtzii]|nr:HET-domain-containing protein [Daldinia eschscholtzii]